VRKMQSHLTLFEIVDMKTCFAVFNKKGLFICATTTGDMALSIATALEFASINDNNVYKSNFYSDYSTVEYTKH